jgi:hypothetical protein
MKAIKVFEVQNFERGENPKKSMKIGEERYKFPSSKIEFTYREGLDAPQIWYNFNSDVYNDEKFLTANDSGISFRIFPLILRFLNDPKTKMEISEILENLDKGDPGFFQRWEIFKKKNIPPNK